MMCALSKYGEAYLPGAMQWLSPHAPAHTLEMLPLVRFSDRMHEHLPQFGLYGNVRLSELEAEDGVASKAVTSVKHATAASSDIKNNLTIFMTLLSFRDKERLPSYKRV
ncbi:MAG: hypothetical protein ABSG90_07165 [Dehalococcoidia bacterium]|jgi:hypothetical protein